MNVYSLGLRLTGGFGAGMDPTAKYIERKPRDLRNDSGDPRSRRPRRKHTTPEEAGKSDPLSEDDGEGDSDVEELYHEAKNNGSPAQNEDVDSHSGSDGANLEVDEMIKEPQPYSGFMEKMDELEVNITNLRTDNTSLKSGFESLQARCTDYEKTIEEERAFHDHEMKRLRAHREDYMKSLEAIQKKLIWDYYVKKYPGDETRLKERHRNGEWLPNDEIIDELLHDFVILGTRNAELLARNDELLAGNEKLHSNLDTLQKSALNNVERFQPTQDDELGEQFDGLASAIKVLTREIPTSIDPETLAELFGEWTLLQGVSKAFWKTKLHMRCLLEAAIWSLLMDTVFSTPFYIFGGNHASVCMQQWMELFAQRDTLEAASESGTFHWPAPSPLCEKWRYVTIEQLKIKAIGSDDIPIDPIIQTSHQDAKSGIEKLLTDHLSPIAPALKPLKIQKIIKKAWDLAVEMGTQRCRLQLVSPELGEEYLSGESSNLMGISGCENLRKGRVAFIANPGLRKWGDGHGANLENYFDLKPALVYVEEI
ncbi:uncharacterized protein BDZ99DRAFT_263868 [Mytilinidion resinicola]|uniref:Uncharacterized protein n=1 Tax=Mytilinidion resinicola TaxID=574789 RepID=A0A6A6YWB1_9PEZI|nr:uncharacterized protein BDZ99DRAFT_263868 [Mytilinidion resinicola]KAF2812275.1 hypothetical protein BDZ99DRAFT_263868 [Mytilinidion resinicola]